MVYLLLTQILIGASSRQAKYHPGIVLRYKLPIASIKPGEDGSSKAVILWHVKQIIYLRLILEAPDESMSPKSPEPV